MDRSRRWTIVLVVILTGVVAGFARLDSEKVAPPPPQVTPQQCPANDEVDPAQGERYLREFTDFLLEMVGGGVDAPALPPLAQWPPLPDELLPPRQQ